MPGREQFAVKASVAEFLNAFRRSFVAGMGGGAAVVATLASAFAPKFVNPLLVGLTALACGVLSAYAIWATEREERLKLQERLATRPIITAKYSQNATEDEQDICDTIIFENIGDETALSIDFVTDPPTFGRHRIRPHLAWSAVTKLSPGDREEASVFSVDTYLREVRAAMTNRDGRSQDVRVPFVITCSDRKEQNWSNTHALVYNGYAIFIENVTGREPRWSDLSGFGQEAQA